MSSDLPAGARTGSSSNAATHGGMGATSTPANNVNTGGPKKDANINPPRIAPEDDEHSGHHYHGHTESESDRFASLADQKRHGEEQYGSNTVAETAERGPMSGYSFAEQKPGSKGFMGEMLDKLVFVRYLSGLG